MESEVGVGTSFIVRIPVNHEHARDILVIDDELTVTQAVVKVCSAEGMTVAAADNATEALRFLEDSKFRLVLCDIMMNELDGFQFLEELDRRGIQTPVVMMTGYSTVENAVKSLTSTGRGLYFETVHRR